jgi:P-type Cu+ transporter
MRNFDGGSPSMTTSSAGIEPRLSTVEIAVGGMTCGACAARVERTLNKVDGVRASVNFATSKARVEYPTSVDVAGLVAAIERAGYGAEPVTVRQYEKWDPDYARIKALWPRLVVAVLLCAPLGDLSIAVVISPSLRFNGWQWVLLAMTIPVATWCAWPFHRAAALAMRHRTTTMDTLVSMGVLSASAWSIYTIFFRHDTDAPGGAWGLLFRPGGSIYLDVVVGVTTFVLAGRLAEAHAKRRAGEALRTLASSGSKQVCLLDPAGIERWAPADTVNVGDVFVVRPGETIATDGRVVDGSASVDVSAMTGEFLPADVGVGDTVLGSTINIDGRLIVRATHTGAGTAIAQLVNLVERAQADKAAIQRLADRVSAVFVPTVMALAAVTFCSWLATTGSLVASFNPALAVLIIACPCALGLATPTALLVSAGRGAHMGIFIKSQQALESARTIDTVVFDKTGTLTTGRMTVCDVAIVAGFDRECVLSLLAAVEDASEHSAGKAISAYVRAAGIDWQAVDDFTALPGRGACGVVDGVKVLAGSPRLFSEQNLDVPADLMAWCRDAERAGSTSVLVALDRLPAAAVALADTIKASASAAVGELRELGLRTIVLTGDNRAAAEAVAADVGIDEVVAQVLPADKAAAIRRLQAQGRRVAMVGDGVNDAPALACADLGLAMVSGADVALDAADLLLIRDDLRVVPCAIRLARATLKTIRGNLVWAFGYNVAAIPLAAAGLLNPLIAGAAMALSSLFVVSNSLRLRKFDAKPITGVPWRTRLVTLVTG